MCNEAKPAKDFNYLHIRDTIVFLRFTRRYGFASSSKGSLLLCPLSKPCCVAGAVAPGNNRITILILRAPTSLSFHCPVQSLPVPKTILQKCSLTGVFGENDRNTIMLPDPTGSGTNTTSGLIATNTVGTLNWNLLI